MLHWTPARTAATIVTPVGAFLGDGPQQRVCIGAWRSDHARMLAHAAKRRRAAEGADGDYWKACAPAAIAKAAAIRIAAGVSRLP
ncbi:hypothetical protein [Caulobacter sp. S45]|uniref:hypothetical protein n=1 Tax=Caulobacter sp. S45 TaxID=1641861 RepID=UPI0015771195|nr:hypothetical protein [Caulobacter sp. S45]